MIWERRIGHQRANLQRRWYIPNMRESRLGLSIVVAASILAAACAWSAWYRVEHSAFRQCLQASSLALKAQGEPADHAAIAAIEMCTGYSTGSGEVDDAAPESRM